MGFTDVIAKKRDGLALSREDIELFISRIGSATLPDYQAAALLMAIVIRGMSEDETLWLTEAMARSGEGVDLSEVPGPRVGKHSTGGVGDKVSIVLSPIAAACGVVVPKISGRGLSHTGGTLDKLESIPGFRVDLSPVEFARSLAEVGASIVGQTVSLAPADKTLYALRDVTATVPSMPLIAASVMSKKLAEGSQAVVLDVKCGCGAFMKSESDARELARLLVAIGWRAGLPTEAFITDMNAPLGWSVGNAVEIVECVELLKGRAPADLFTLVTTLVTRVLVLSGRYTDTDAAGAVRRAMDTGEALRKFREMVARQGGDVRVLDEYTLLPQARGRHQVVADRDGFLTDLRADLVGRASMALGAGRRKMGESIDHGAGVLIRRKPGDHVRTGEPILELLYNDQGGLEEASELARASIGIADTPPVVGPLVLGRISDPLVGEPV